MKTHETNQLDATSSELRLKLGESTELSGADGSEVILHLSKRSLAYKSSNLPNRLSEPTPARYSYSRGARRGRPSCRRRNRGT